MKVNVEMRGNSLKDTKNEVKKGLKTELEEMNKNEYKTITFKEIVKNTEINAYIDMANEALGVLGYTDHSQIHAMKVAKAAAKILKELGYSKREIELVKIAGFMHDIGNSVNRHDHAHSGAIMAFEILTRLGMDPTDIAVIISAIGNHDEQTGSPVTPVSAALIIADKSDVRRDRVRNEDKETFDMHDRVNYAVLDSAVSVNTEKSVIHLDIKLDESSCCVLDYFEIFLERMLMCKRAAALLKMKFKFTVNGNKVL